MADDAAPKLITRLLPEDEYTHTPDATANYNESMYFNVFDHASKVGGWFRIGNRPNEGYAEMSVCLYLPDGRIGFMFGRPKIANNAEMNAGGLKIEVVEPFKKLRLSFEGKVCLLARPFEMANPSKAFRENPHVRARGFARLRGGQPDVRRRDRARGRRAARDRSGKVVRQGALRAACRRTRQLPTRRRNLAGRRLWPARQVDWGPRHWSAINCYRWCPMNFGRDFRDDAHVDRRQAGRRRARRQHGVRGAGAYDLISECKNGHRLRWDEHGYQTGLRAKVKTRGGKSYEVSGKVLSLIPLRSRRTTPDAQELNTRITEGMAEYRCGDLVGYGLSESSRPDRRRPPAPAARRGKRLGVPRPSSAPPAALSTMRPRACPRRASRPAPAGPTFPTTGSVRTAAWPRPSSRWSN